MILSTTTDDFFDVTDLAKAAGCDLAVWFSRSLWDWCQQSETSTGLWSKAAGLLRLLSRIPDDTLSVGGQVQLSYGGEKIIIDLASWTSPSDTRVTLVSLSETVRHDRPTNRITAKSTISPNNAGAQHEFIPFYFICELCDANWFAETQAADCPRCHTHNHSKERIVPPWWKDRR